MTTNRIEGRLVGAYFSSVTLVTASLVGYLAISAILDGAESATNFSPWTKAGHLALLSGIAFVVFWMASIVLAALPSYAIIWAACALRISNPLFYLISGAAVGLFVDTILSTMHPTWYTDPPDMPSATPLIAWLTGAKTFCLLGALGGAKFWRKALASISRGTRLCAEPANLGDASPARGP